MTPEETITLECEIIASSGVDPSKWIAEHGRQYREAIDHIQGEGGEPTKSSIERLLYKDRWFEQECDDDGK